MTDPEPEGYSLEMLPITPNTLLGCNFDWAFGFAAISAILVWFGFSRGDWPLFGGGIAFYISVLALLRWTYIVNPWMLCGVLDQYLEFPAYIPATASYASERQREKLRRKQVRNRFRRR